MTINLTLPATHELKPKITVIGVGGAGGNAVNNMITAHLEGVEFVAANTDAQALSQALTERRIQLGASLTQGLGAGARPDIGKAAAEEVLDGIIDFLQGANMVFITAGMGGGTGTGAAPVIAGAARDLGILTVGVVTKPFQFEGTQRMRLAESGIAELQKYVDTLIVIPNQNLFRIANEKTTFADAFKMADDVLYSGVRGVTDLMVMPGLINLDFADIRSVMMEMGKAMMGTGEAEGEKRAVEAAELAINNPLLDDVSLNGARGVLVNITGGGDMTLYEVDEACNRIRDQVDSNANIIFGSTFDDNLSGRVRVSVVATGIDADAAMTQTPDTLAVVQAPRAEVLTDILDVEPALRQTQPDREPAKPEHSRHEPPRHEPPRHEPPRHEPNVREPAQTVSRARVEPVLHTRRDAGFIAPVPVDPDAMGASPQREEAPRIDFGEERTSLPSASPLARPEEAAPAISGGNPQNNRFSRKPVEDATLAARAKSSGASLFERMSRVARARSDVEPAVADQAERQGERRPEARDSESRAAPVAAPVATPSQARSEDDLLDIPAFLRRQRN